MANPNPKRRQLSKADTLKGGANSGLVRVHKAAPWLMDIYSAVKILSRRKLLPTTNDQIAARLSLPPFSITAPRGGVLTGKLVHNAFVRLGVDRGQVRRWRRIAGEAARDFGLDDPQPMIFQLWHEWQHHEAVSVFKLGLNAADRATRKFVPHLVHPREWIPPWVRDPDPQISLSGPPPWAHLTQALMFTIDPDKEDADYPDDPKHRVVDDESED